MKQRSTTPVSKATFAMRACIIAATVLSLSIAPFTAMPVKADKYDDQLNALNQQIEQYDAQANALKSQGDTLQAELSRLVNQKARIQAQLDLSVTKEKQLNAQIVVTQKKLEDNKSLLGDTIADIYVEGKASKLEVLAGSNNFADYVDRVANQEQVQDTVNQTISEINTLKTQLEKQKIEIQRVIADQKTSRDALAAKEQEQATLVAKTRGQQSAYEQLSAKSREQQAQVRQAQQAAIAAAIASSGGATLVQSGADANYPWNSGNCPMVGYFSTGGVDGSGLDGHGYGCRQCVSYVAWRVARETGYYPTNWGNATNVPANARAAGYSTGYTARAGSLGVMHSQSAGVPEGHVVWIETNPDSSGQVLVSQYNYNYGGGYGMYSKMMLSASAFDEFVYIK